MHRHGQCRHHRPRVRIRAGPVGRHPDRGHRDTGPGFVHVFVHGHGTSTGFGYDRFHYLPDITALSPSSGPAGTQVTITGHGFTRARALMFGNVPATSFTVVSDTQVTAVVPDLPAGTVACG